jgi:hypothetical protein
MKNLKKTFALVLTIALLATMFLVPAFAVEMTAAEKLETLGILVGSGGGVTPEYLAGPATRITSAILLLKLKGLIADAEAWNGTENFSDADTAMSLYARTVMGYLKENPAVGFVGYQDKFTPNTVITAQEYYKVLLTALGYEQGVDFEWATVIEFAATVGLSAIADVTALTIDDFATATVEALNAEVNGTGMTLIEKLVDDGVVDIADATAAGWDFTPVIETATQIAKNKIAVTFSTAVDTAVAVLKLKQGVMIYYATVAWNAAKDVATLTTAVNPIPAGTYTVEVTGLGAVQTMNVTATAPVATSIAVTTAILYDGSSSIAFSVMNQFGEDMGVLGNAAGMTGTAYITAGHPGVLAVTGNAASTFSFAAGSTAVGDVIQFTLVYNGMPVTKVFTVQADPAASTIAFGTVMPLAGQSFVFVSTAGYAVPYQLFDQYGTATTLAAHGANADAVANQETIGGILFITSNAAIVNPDTFVVSAAGALTFTTGATAGTAIVTAIWNATIVGQLSVTVSGAPTAAVATIGAPTALVAAGDAAFNLGLTLVDQYGGAVTGIGGLTADISLAGATVTLVNATTLSVNVSGSTVAATTAVTVRILNGATVIGTLVFGVQPNSAATQLTGVTFPVLFQAGGAYTVTRAACTVLDQYGRAFAGGAVTVVDGAAATFTTAGAVITAVSEGADTITVQVGASNVVPVTVTCIPAATALTYTLSSNKATVYASATAGYFATVTLAGKNAANETVVLNSTLPTSKTSSNTAVAVITGGGLVQGVAAGTVTIYAWNGGTLLASTVITVTAAAPVATAISFSATTIVHGTDLSTILVITDQYGVNIAAVGNYVVATSNAAAVTAAGLTPAAGTATVTVVKDAVLSPATLITVT